MKYAAAMRYGGELVDACDCDYEDYKYLGLLCPECKEPVILRTASVRNINGKTFPVNACFCHRESKDDETDKACDLRINGYSAEEIEKRSAVARGQRLRLLQRWFWEIFSRHPKRKGFYEQNEKLIAALVQSFDGNWSKALNTSMRRFRNAVTPTNRVKGLIDDIFFVLLKNGAFANAEEETEMMLRSVFAGIGDLDLILANIELFKDLDLDKHKQICLEVLDFVCAKSQSALLSSVLEFENVYLMICGISGDLFDLEDSDKSEKMLAVIPCLSALVTLITTPWAKEFAKLEKQHPIAANEPQRSPNLRRSRSTSSGKGFAMPKS